ncbi:protein tyrosine phosphatase [Bacillus mangrovi]|uniref:Protein tyrosine phosphatase n=1 Tax=Metabacillus mangrovi TaxID=1491830 RepID=A0A7X2V398_9BACI|nr:dual specificity protein phosphatase family protein [Metabacillus mangrovi]MTH51884.1 protein tyrosine phosphatase [Metabacillus mangrovi]
MEKSYQQLVKNRIFIGGADDINELLNNEKIDVIYDLRAEADSGQHVKQRVHLPIVDDSEKQDDSVKRALDEVEKAYNENKNIYFHCSGGKNRTGTVAIGTLINLGLADIVDEAERKAKSIRPAIQVKPEMKDTLNRLYK